DGRLRCRRRPPRERKVQDERLWMGLAEEPLKRPASTLFDFVGDGRQRDDPAKARGLAVVAKAGQVPLDAVVPGDQRSRLLEPNRAVGGDQATAGGRGKGLREEDRQGRRRRGD